MGKRSFAALLQGCIVLLLLFCFSGHGLADEVVLSNGDRLTGKIIEVRDGVLTLETGYSEPIKLKFEAVQEISSTESVELHLTDGEVFKGKITTGVDKQVTVGAGSGREAVAVVLDNITDKELTLEEFKAAQKKQQPKKSGKKKSTKKSAKKKFQPKPVKSAEKK